MSFLNVNGHIDGNFRWPNCEKPCAGVPIILENIVWIWLNIEEEVQRFHHRFDIVSGPEMINKLIWITLLIVDD